MEKDGHRVINLGIGSPDLDPHPDVLKVLHTESQSSGAHAYQSYRGIPELRKAFADWYHDHFAVELDPGKEILPLIGSKEGIMHLSMTFLSAGDLVLVPNPGYPAYRAAACLSGAETIDYHLSDKSGWLPDLSELKKLPLDKVKLMWINYPHMPTGSKANTRLYEELLSLAEQHHFLLCNDNPYSFILNSGALSLLSIPGAKKYACELNSLSKSHNLAGWRIGMLAGHEKLIDHALKFKSNMDSGMFKVVQLAAVRALQLDNEWYCDLNEIYMHRKEIAQQLVTILGCKKAVNQVGMFIWTRVPQHFRDGFEFSDWLLKRCKIFVTPGGIFGSNGADYIRVSLCNDQDLFMEAMERVTAFEIEKKLPL
jgi:aspartate/methionine/tyrosine aminotransferase